MRTSIISSRNCLSLSVAIIAQFTILALAGAGLELPIANRSFESPILSDGGGTFTTPSWTGQGTFQIFNPNTSYFTGVSDSSTNSPLDGKNAASINAGGSMAQQTTNLLKSSSIYSLTFLAGYRSGVPFGNGSVSLWAGTNLLAEQFPIPPEGTFAQYSLSYTSPPAGVMIGQPIRIELKATGANSQPWFDNLQLYSEASTCTPHRAQATAQLFNGIFVGGVITDSGCGYTSAPPVLIQGGGGTGALANAILTNGAVVGIQVINGGCCYTNVPTIFIGSPPFVPTVEIRVSKISVTQNVVFGRKYILESSNDLMTWTATGPSFTAISERMESEFDVGSTGRFFRLIEVP